MSYIKFKINGDLRGKLIAIDSEFDLPFNIKRIFYIRDLDNLERGYHAHRKCEQILVPINGSFTLRLDDGNKINEYFLDKPNEGIHIPLYNWISMKNFTKDCIIMVICSFKYDEEEYIRDYDTFLKEVKGNNQINKIYNFSLKEQTKLLKRKVLSNIEKIIDRNEFVMGSEVINFENKFAEYNNINYCIGVSNCCSALKIAIKSLELKNPRVLVQANTYVAVPLVCEELQIKYDLIDIDDNLLLDLTKLEEYLQNNNENSELVLMLVHLYGNCVDMDKLLNLKKKYNFKLIEDAAQAHGSTFNNKKLGTFGDLGCFSFYPSKNLGAFGEAGAIVTNNQKYYEYCKKYRNYGSIERYKWNIIGGNERMDNIQGSILSTKLEYLDEWNNKRREIAKYYLENLKEDNIKILKPIINCISNYHLFLIITNKRNELKKIFGK